MQAETRGDDLVQLCFFLRDPGLIMNSTHRLPQLEQVRHRRSRIGGIELRSDLTNFSSNGLGIRDARPARVDAFEKRTRHRLTFQRFEIFLSLPPPWQATDALALVHAYTGGRAFRVRFAEKRIVTADF